MQSSALWSIPARSSASRASSARPGTLPIRRCKGAYCGGAHPDDFALSYNLDVTSGKVLQPGDIFSNWTDEQPSQALIDLVEQRRSGAASGGDDAAEDECDVDELIASNLAIHFRRVGANAFAVFGLENLPHVITTCGAKLLELPVSAVEPFMTPGAKALFTEHLQSQ